VRIEKGEMIREEGHVSPSYAGMNPLMTPWPSHSRTEADTNFNIAI
jgi:hypothetical protein